ncbi:MAG: flavodoxin family protein [Promethearchaeota archaeon]
MNIPILLGSSQSNNSETSIIITETARELDRIGFKTQIFSTAELNFAACAGCLECEPTDECVVQDDIQMIQKHFLEAPGIIIASPVYLLGPPGRLKCLLDRFWHWTLRPRLFGKYAAVVVNSTGYGTDEVAEYLTAILESWGMYVLSPPTLSPEIQDRTERRKKMLIDCRLLGRKFAEYIQKKKKITISSHGKKLVSSIWKLIQEEKENYQRSHTYWLENNIAKQFGL